MGNHGDRRSHGNFWHGTVLSRAIEISGMDAAYNIPVSEFSQVENVGLVLILNEKENTHH